LLRRRRPRNTAVIVLLFVLVFLVGLFLVIEFNLKPTILAFAEAQARWTATKAIHAAILEEIGSDISYKDIVHIEKDSRDRIVFMQPNIIKINKLASSATLNIQRSLEELKNNKFKIPLGQILGSKLLAHYGPAINLVLLPVGTVEVFPRDSFQEAGINQTRHRIYLEVNSDIKVVIPYISSVVDVKLQVPVADAVIVGDVPDTYLNLDINREGLLSPSYYGFKPENMK